MTIACGDSHTSTHGAFGSVAFGIGTSQVRDVLASQCLALEPLQVRRIDVTGPPGAGRLRQRRHPRDHPAAGRQRRRRLRLRVRRPGRGPHVDGRADDDLQHVHRRRGARGLRQPRPRRRLRSSKAGRSAPQGEAFDAATDVLAGPGLRCRRALRRPRDHRRRRARAHRDLGHQSRASRCRSAAGCPIRATSATRIGRASKRRCSS